MLILTYEHLTLIREITDNITAGYYEEEDIVIALYVSEDEKEVLVHFDVLKNERHIRLFTFFLSDFITNKELP